ncbi:MAG TPA: NUDIX domain-containing protein [Acidobacteriaceae bacterium]
MPKQSAGLLMYRRSSGRPEVFLVHPGGPFWAKKDLGAWTIPKGEYQAGEDPLAAAQREFQEETSFTPAGAFLLLGTVRQASGKTVIAWAFEGDCDPAQLVSNTCMIEWPPRSARHLEIPEVDRGAWFPLDEARIRIRKEQIAYLSMLAEMYLFPLTTRVEAH